MFNAFRLANWKGVMPALLLSSGLWTGHVRAAEPRVPAAAAAQNTFDIQEFRVLGNHLLAAVVIERAVYPYLGPAGTIETVKQAADALEKAYQDSGYGTVFVDIPEQQVDDGIVRLKVTEGVLERVHVRGDRYFSDRQIRAALPALQAGQTPQLSALQSELGALNVRSADRTITPVLKAGTEPGTLDVDLAVKDTLPLHGSLQYDNRHTADTTPNRATASLSYDNLWQRQDSIGVQYQTAPAKPSDAEVLMANYTGHIDSQGALAALSYIHTSSSVLALGTLGVLGKGSIYGAHWLLPFGNSATRAQSFNAGIDYKDVLTQVFPDAVGGTASAAVSAAVRYLNWSAMYSGTWWRGGQTYSTSAGVGFGVRSAFNSPDEFENARYNAYPDYFYVRLSFSATEALPLGLALQQRANAQWADSPLVNNEQFSLGGADSVRGYLEAETLGDTGITGTLELHSPRLGKHVPAFLSPLYGFLFVDAGVTTLVDPLPSQLENFSLWSTGLGLRLDNTRGLMGTLDWAIPQRNGVRTRKDQSRVDFLMRYGF
jgi:hemolysin activation/secretion protein